MRYGRIIKQKRIENEKEKISFPPPGDSQSAQTCFFGVAEQMLKYELKFQMGITGAPFGRTELLVPPPEPQERALARGKGPRGPGGWGDGKKLKNVSCLGHLFLNF